jgi:hypothetical protein
MKLLPALLIAFVSTFGTIASAQEITELSCADFKPTPEAMERFPDLEGACEAIVDRDGQLFAKFRAVVRRASNSSATLHLPATNHTFRVNPDSSARVLIEGRKTRIRDLQRGQEIRIYLAVSEFAKPDVEEIIMVTESDFLVAASVEPADALPTTASPWPALAALGLMLLAGGLVLRQVRSHRSVSGLLGAAMVGLLLTGLPVTEAQANEDVAMKPARVTTSTVQTGAIVESVNRDTRELKLIDAGGKRFSMTAGPEVVNFDQIEARDRIVVEYIEQLAVVVTAPGAPELGDAVAAKVAAEGEKPGMAVAQTSMVRVTVEDLDRDTRMAKLQREDGSSFMHQVAEDTPLDLINVGDEVRMRTTSAIAISVRKADS